MRTSLFCLLASLPLAAQTALPPPATVKVDFIRDVEPLLTQKCHSCHGPEVQQSGLRLDRRQNAMRGGDYGPVIVPGKSADSKLIRRLVSGDGGMVMPPTEALSRDEISLLRAWIDQGADFRLQVKDEAPAKPVDPKLHALITAVRADDQPAVKKLLAASPELLNAKDAAGATPLHHAAGYASLATMQFLLDQGADCNLTNRRKSTPLFWAIHDEAKVRLLLARGAQVNHKQAEGRTPLFQAAGLGNATAIVRLLLDSGADPGATTANGQTPLHMAALRGNRASLKLLLARKVNVNARAGNGATALMGASSSGDSIAVQILLAAGADPNLLTKKKDSALGDAATSGVEASVRLLLDHGAKVNVQDDRGYSPLMYAAASDTQPAAVVKLLLDKGADPSLTGEGETARTLAAKRGDTEVARLLSVPEADRLRGGVALVTTRERPYSIPVAVAKATALLEQQSHNFIRIGGCNSCHAQDLTSAAAALARDRGLAAPKRIAQLPESMRGLEPERVMDFGAVGVGSAAWELFDFGTNRVPSTPYTDAIVHYIQVMQTPEGHWRTPQSRRPPMSSGEYQTAALAIYSLANYSTSAQKVASEQAILRAAAWLEQAQPTNTQDRAFQLLGLAWAKANATAIGRSAKSLAASQRADGGWSQLPSMDSDAYATGQALYALTAAGKVPTTDPRYQKGVAYLLRTQAEDGSWHVQTRSIWIQPYFESGFPYAHDQWISVAGTAWASMALSVAHGPQTISRR